MPLPPIVASYQPLLELASGGMASVYAVRQVGAQGFERVVVMKRVHPHLVGIQDFREMFLDEARLSSLIRHPNIVPVIDVVEEGEELFLIMEYIESISLSQLLRGLQGARIAPPVVSRIVCDVLSGLHAAHEAVDLRGQPMNIIHRDVSPQNIILGVDGTSRLIDFGIAKASTRLTPTTNGLLKGKFGYMAPEQIRQHALDRRVDVFAAGVVLHETLTSARLFAAGDEADAILGVLVREVPDPSTLVPGLSKEVDAVVHRALARDREDRFATASDFGAALEAACPPASPREIAALVATMGEGSLVERRRKLQAAFDRPAVATSGTNPGPVEVPIVWKPDSSAVGRRRRLILGIGASGIVLAAGALAVSLAFGSRQVTPSAAPSASSSASTDTSATAASTAPPIESSSASAAASTPTPLPSVFPRPTTPRPPARPPRPANGDIHKSNPYLAH